jgi:hypothetical protein
MHRLVPILFLLLLAGCAERWSRPGTSEAQSEAANEACADQATLAVPVQNVWTMVDPGGFERHRRCWRTRNNQEVCDWVTNYRPPRHAWVDVNRGPRDAWRRECMRGQGYQFEGYRPLRLE